MNDTYPSDEPNVNREDQKAARAVQSLSLPALTPESVKKIERRALERIRKKKQRAFRFPQFHSIPRFAVALSVVIALVLATNGTVAASAGSLPGEPLYAVKRLTEQMELLLASADQQAMIHAAHAETRLSEIEKLAAKGVVSPGLLNEMQAETQAAVSGAKTLPAKQQASVLSAIVILTNKQETALVKIQSQLPPTHASQSNLSSAQTHSSAQRQEIIIYAEKSAIPLITQHTPTATATRPAPTATATVTTQPTATQPTLTPTSLPARTATATQQPTATPRPSTQSALVVPTQQSAQSTATSSGATSTPPGQEKTPPGQEKTPPGQEKTPPGQEKIPPGQDKNPPGQENNPPGQDKNPSGGGGGKKP